MPRTQISPREILHEGPSRLREKERRDAAAEVMFRTKRMFETKTSSGIVWTLNPKVMGKSSGFGA
jgi:hypothetical protein